MNNTLKPVESGWQEFLESVSGTGEDTLLAYRLGEPRGDDLRRNYDAEGLGFRPDDIIWVNPHLKPREGARVVVKEGDLYYITLMRNYSEISGKIVGPIVFQLKDHRDFSKVQVY